MPPAARGPSVQCGQRRLACGRSGCPVFRIGVDGSLMSRISLLAICRQEPYALVGPTLIPRRPCRPYGVECER